MPRRLPQSQACSVIPELGFYREVVMSRWKLMPCIVVLLMSAHPADARRYEAARRQTEVSMVLTGVIEIDAAGRVSGYAVEKAGEVDPAALGLLAKRVPHWRFQPVLVEGEPVGSRSRMRLRLVGARLDNGDYSLSVRAADFPPLSPPADNAGGPVPVKLRQPVFPLVAFSRKVSGMAYVVARVAPSGKVVEAAVEQVNLGTVGSERDMGLWREHFGAAAVSAAKASEFKPFRVSVDSPASLMVRIPYVFRAVAKASVDRPYGQWSAYIPGPRQSVPWLHRVNAGPPDLLAAGQLQSLGSDGGLKRLGPPGDG